MGSGGGLGQRIFRDMRLRTERPIGQGPGGSGSGAEGLRQRVVIGAS